MEEQSKQVDVSQLPVIRYFHGLYLSIKAFLIKLGGQIYASRVILVAP